MDPPKLTEDILTAKTELALMRIPIHRLKVFCEDRNLTVHSTGQRGSIKKDFASAIWVHVSDTIIFANINILTEHFSRNKDPQRPKDHWISALTKRIRRRPHHGGAA